MTKGPSEVLHRWFQHFKKVLNVRSIYDSSVLDAWPVSPSLFRLDDPPTMAKLEAAMSRLKKRKAGGMSGILLELVICSSPVLLDRLPMLMQAVWREGRVPRDWRNTQIVPVPRKAIFSTVITSVGSVYWMLLVSYLLGLSKIICR